MKQTKSVDLLSRRKIPSYLLRRRAAAFIYFLIFALSNSVYPQRGTPDEAIDTSPIELYLQNTNFIKRNGKPDATLLKQYFSNATIKLFMQRPGFDSSKFINSLISVYANKPNTIADKDGDYELMLKYKQNEDVIRKSVDRVKKTRIDKMVKARLKSFYPISFLLDSIHLRHVYLFIEEGNGGLPGYVFNSALHTAYLDKKDIDLISSHEAYHTITNSIFMEKFQKLFNSKSNDSVTNHQNLIWYLEIVSEEGIADLIDKKILSSGTSPLAQETKKLRVNEVFRSEQKILQLDSLLANNNVRFNFLTLEGILENGGHIPGRYMAEKIQSANLLKEYVEHTGNPFQFFYYYNEAVKDSISAPRFSTRSITYLKALEAFLREN